MLGTSNVKFTQPIYLYPLKYIGSIVDIYGGDHLFSRTHCSTTITHNFSNEYNKCIVSYLPILSFSSHQHGTFSLRVLE